MDLKIYTCDYLNHGGGGITDEMTFFNKKQTHGLSDTFCVGRNAFFHSFSTVHSNDHKNKSV